MPNHTTISTANYRVQAPVWTDWWMRGDRYGVVQREYHARNQSRTPMVLVLMDRSNKLARFRSEDVEVIT